ncbi:MAG TPA: cysteine--tRNA ligase, partial [Firmicutes bacterium]|nr:cysteine--tRNA ligase [Bacillota bacterium]
GWHIECSAMSLKYLGKAFDFHGGGNDLIFPHHENEIAQSEAATGSELARYWVHNGMLNLKDTKMSKSIGNVIAVKALIKRYPKELLRFYLLSTHYRSALEFYDGKLEEVSKGWKRLNDAFRNLEDDLGRAHDDELTSLDQETLETLSNLEEKLVAALADDFNTAMAFGVLFDVVREVNAYKHRQGNALQVLQKAFDILEAFAGNIFGVLQVEGTQDAGLVDSLLDLLLGLREELRKEKNFALSDQIRDQLANLGVTIEDTPQGPRWKV